MRLEIWFQEMRCCAFVVLDGEIIRYSELHIFWWALLSKDEACHTLESLLQNHHAVFLELGVVYQPVRERYIYLLKNTFWQHLSNWSPGKSFSSSQSSEWWITSVSAVCMCIQSSVCKTANTYLCPPLATCSNKLSSNSKLLI